MAKKFKVPFAFTGDKTTVPVALQPDGSVSYTQGFGPDYELDKLVDPINAKDVPRDQTNQLFFDVTESLGEVQLYGAALWSADMAPYPLNARVAYAGKYWRSNTAANSDEPGVGAGWDDISLPQNAASFGIGTNTPPQIGNLDDPAKPGGIYRYSSASDTGTNPTGGALNGVVLIQPYSATLSRQVFREVVGGAGLTSTRTWERQINGATLGSWVLLGLAMPFGYLSGFQMANDGTSPLTTVSVGAGAARSSTDTVDIKLGSAMRGILQDSGAWSAGDNQNKLDTGARANNSWYHVYAIRKTSDGTADILFSLSATAPTMPSGYAGFRRISAVKTDGSGNIIQFLNFGRNFTFKTPQLDVDVASAIVDAAYVLSVPTGVEVKAKLGMFCSSGDASWSYRSPSANAIVPNHLDYRGGSLMVTTENPDRLAVDTEIVTNSSAQIHFRTALSSAFRVVTYGWTEL